MVNQNSFLRFITGLTFIFLWVSLVSSLSSNDQVSDYSDFKRSSVRRNWPSQRHRSRPYFLSGSNSYDSSDTESEVRRRYRVTDLLEMLEEAKHLQPTSPLIRADKKNGPVDAFKEGNTDTPNFNLKNGSPVLQVQFPSESFLRMPYLRDSELQNEFQNLIKEGLRGHEKKQQLIEMLYRQSHYREAKEFLQILNNKIDRLMISIEAARFRGVPYKAVTKTDKLISLKKKTISYMENEMKKVLENFDDSEEKTLLEKCGLEGPFFISPAEEVFLGSEIYMPTKKILVLINFKSSMPTLYLGFLYTTRERRTRLVRLMRPLILDQSQFILSGKSITIADVDPKNALNEGDAVQIKANILSAVMSHHKENKVYGMKFNFGTSKGLQYLASCHTEEEIRGALRYISVHEPHLMYLGLESQGSVDLRNFYVTPMSSQFINMYLPEQRPASSILEAYLNSGMTKIMSAIHSNNMFPEVGLINVEGLARQNIFVSSISCSSVTTMKFLGVFIFKNSYYVKAMKDILEENTESQVLLLPKVKRKAMFLSKNACNEDMNDCPM